MMRMVEQVGGLVLASLAMVHWTELAVLEEVEVVVPVAQAVLTGLVERSAYAARLGLESMSERRQTGSFCVVT